MYGEWKVRKQALEVVNVPTIAHPNKKSPGIVLNRVYDYS